MATIKQHNTLAEKTQQKKGNLCTRAGILDCVPPIDPVAGLEAGPSVVCSSELVPGSVCDPSVFVASTLDVQLLVPLLLEYDLFRTGMTVCE